jgi:hypothetical protein
MKNNFYQKLGDLHQEVSDAIETLLKENGGRIDIPYYFETQEEIDEKENDEGYDFRVGDPYNNILINAVSFCGNFEIEVTSVSLRNNKIYVDDIDTYYYIDDIEDIQELIYLYDVLLNATKK